MTTPMVMAVRRRLVELLSGEPSPQQLNASLRHLAKWRAQVLENTLVTKSGDVVLSGPFKGLRYAVRASEGSRNARLIGCYEACLHGVIQKIVASGYKLVIDVGSAEGYYATKSAYNLNQGYGANTPIIDAVYSVLYEGKSAKSVFKKLADKLD